MFAAVMEDTENFRGLLAYHKAASKAESVEIFRKETGL